MASVAWLRKGRHNFAADFGGVQHFQSTREESFQTAEMESVFPGEYGEGRTEARYGCVELTGNNNKKMNIESLLLLALQMTCGINIDFLFSAIHSINFYLICFFVPEEFWKAFIDLIFLSSSKLSKLLENGTLASL